MSRFVIHGGRPLQGEIRASGSKNAVLPMIAAALLTEEEVVLENVPSIRDVDVMLEIAGQIGAEVSRLDDRVTIKGANLTDAPLPAELCEKVRTSVLFVAPLLHRLGRAKLHPPGGDGIGRRRLDTHFYGLRQLGVTVDEVEFEFTAQERMEGALIFFDEASVTATEHILMAASLAKGTTTILNAASEPHVMDLALLLIGMGADIEGLYTNTLRVTGVERLHGATHRVVSDHIEVGSYLALAAATGGGITIHDTVRGHYWMMNRVFERFGIELDIKSDRIVLPAGQTPKIQPDAGGAVPSVDDGPWPQFPTDMMSPFLVLATQSEGTILFFEKMFEGRMYFVDPLIQMGANAIITTGTVAGRNIEDDGSSRSNRTQSRYPRRHGHDHRGTLRDPSPLRCTKCRDSGSRIRTRRRKVAGSRRRHRARSRLNTRSRSLGKSLRVA